MPPWGRTWITWCRSSPRDECETHLADLANRLKNNASDHVVQRTCGASS